MVVATSKPNLPRNGDSRAGRSSPSSGSWLTGLQRTKPGNEGAARLQLKSGLDLFKSGPRRGTGNLGAALATPTSRQWSLHQARPEVAEPATHRIDGSWTLK